MALTESLGREAFRVLMDTVCVCGSKKAAKQSFCRACYFALPAKMRSALYTPFSEGYAEIWDEARCYLREQTDRLVK